MAHWPQFLTAIWLGLTIPGHCYGAGTKSDNHLAAVHVLLGVLKFVVPMTVLYFGGFFAVWGWAP